MYVRVCACAHMRAYMRVCTCVHMHAYARVHVHVYVCACAHTHVYVWVGARGTLLRGGPGEELRLKREFSSWAAFEVGRRAGSACQRSLAELRACVTGCLCEVDSC